MRSGIATSQKSCAAFGEANAIGTLNRKAAAVGMPRPRARYDAARPMKPRFAAYNVVATPARAPSPTTPP